MADDAHADLEAFLEATRDRRMTSYMDFVRIPSVSGQPEHAADCRAAAAWLADDMSSSGI